MTETTTPSVEGDRLEATNDQLHFAVSTFLARYKGNNGLEAMREATAPMFPALPCKGGEDEPFGVSGASNEVEALAVALFAHRCPGLIMYDDDVPYYEDAARAAFRTLDEPATPTTEPDTGRGLREALEALEPFHQVGQFLFARDLPDDTPMVRVDSINGSGFHLSRGHFKAASLAYRVLAALSDTPGGREISEVETHRADAVAPASKGGAE